MRGRVARVKTQPGAGAGAGGLLSSLRISCDNSHPHHAAEVQTLALQSFVQTVAEK